MKYYLFFIVIITVMSFKSMANIRNPHEGEICHVEAEYFYPGVWEKHGDNELICNYWRFLGDEDRQILESQLSEDNDESNTEYGDYDSAEEIDGE